jgi:hypothetical protein
MANEQAPKLVSTHVSADLHARLQQEAVRNERTVAQEVRQLLRRTYDRKTS